MISMDEKLLYKLRNTPYKCFHVVLAVLLTLTDLLRIYNVLIRVKYYAHHCFEVMRLTIPSYMRRCISFSENCKTYNYWLVVQFLLPLYLL